jgi:hypothetical protein
MQRAEPRDKPARNHPSNLLLHGTNSRPCNTRKQAIHPSRRIGCSARTSYFERTIPPMQQQARRDTGSIAARFRDLARNWLFGAD